MWATRLSGKLNGEIAPTTPIGSRSVNAELPFAGLRGVHRHHLAGKLPRLDRGHRVGRHRARRLHLRRLERLAGLGRDRLRHLLVPPAEEARDAHEDLGALVRRERLAHGGFGGIDRAARLGCTGLRDPPDQVAGVRRAHLDPVARLDPLAADQQLLLGRRHGHPLSLCSRCGLGSTDRRRRPQPDRQAERVAAGTRGDELAAQVLNGLVGRHDLDPAEVEDVQMGCVTQIGEQGWNIGRMAPMVAGWPETVCGTTVDRQCGSSMQTNFNAAAAVWAGQLDVVVSAGVEMMSRVPMGSNGGDLSDKLLERWQIVPQGISAEALASEWNLSREALDAFSLESHRRAIAAIDDGRFENEIVPVEVGAAGAAVLFAVDEAPRRDTSAEKLASLQPAFLPDGVVTAGNSSQIVDGAAAVLVASEAAAGRLGLEPRARFVSFGLCRRRPVPDAARQPARRAGRRSRRPGSAGTTSR